MERGVLPSTLHEQQSSSYDSNNVVVSKGAQQYEALVAFLGTFTAIEEVHEETLNDGVQILDCLCEIAPDYFQPTLLHRAHLDNWILRLSNLRKLWRHLQVYFQHALRRSLTIPVDLQAMAKDSNTIHTTSTVEPILQAVAIAAVQHVHDKSVYVERILNELSPAHQAAVKTMLVDAMDRYCLELTDEMEDTTTATESSLTEVMEETVFLETETAFLNHSSQRTRSQPHRIADDTTHSTSTAASDIAAIADWKRRLGTAESRATAAEDALEQLQAQMELLMEDKQRLADDLDIAKAAQQQLYRAQATAAAYKERWEASCSMDHQSSSGTRNDGAGSSTTSSDLETVAALRATIASLQEQMQEQDEEIARFQITEKKHYVMEQEESSAALISPVKTQGESDDDDDHAAMVQTLQHELRHVFDAYQQKTQEHAAMVEQLEGAIAPGLYQQACDAMSQAQTEAYEWRERAEALERELAQQQQPELVSDDTRTLQRKKKSSKRRDQPHAIMSRTIKQYGLGMY